PAHRSSPASPPTTPYRGSPTVSRSTRPTTRSWSRRAAGTTRARSTSRCAGSATSRCSSRAAYTRWCVRTSPPSAHPRLPPPRAAHRGRADAHRRSGRRPPRHLPPRGAPGHVAAPRPPADRRGRGLRERAAGRQGRPGGARAVGRRYAAWVAGDASALAGARVALPLAHDPRDRRRMLPATAGVRAWPAETRLAIVAAGRERSLVEATILTGVTHQVRVHLAARGHPVLGDVLYGGA